MSNPIAECYEYVSTPFGAQASYYSRPQGHSGADYPAITGDAIIAYEDFVVTSISWSEYIGWCLEGKSVRSGDYIGWAHIRGAVVQVGQLIKAGLPFAEVAGPNDRPGTTWFGSHIHTTRSKQQYGIFYGATYDPAPYITASKAAWAAGEIKPIPKEKKLSIRDLYTEYARKGGQSVKAGETAHVYIGDAPVEPGKPGNPVAVAAGRVDALSGNVVVTVSGGKPGDSITIVPYVRTWKAGKLISETTLKARERIFTPGNSTADTAVNVALRVGDRLSFKIGGSSSDFKIVSVVFRGSAINED